MEKYVYLVMNAKDGEFDYAYDTYEKAKERAIELLYGFTKDCYPTDKDFFVKLYNKAIIDFCYIKDGEDILDNYVYIVKIKKC